MNKSLLITLLVGFLFGVVTYHFSTISDNEKVHAKLESVEMSLIQLSSQLSSLENMQNTPESFSLSQTESGADFDESDANKLSEDVLNLVYASLENNLQSQLSSIMESIQQNTAQTKSVAMSAEQQQVAIQARDQSNAILNNAIQKQIWENSDKQAFNDALSKMTLEDQFEAQRQLSIAINNGDIQIPDDMTLF